MYALYERICLDRVWPPNKPTPIKGVNTPALKANNMVRSLTVPFVMVLLISTRSIGAVQGTFTKENSTPRKKTPLKVPTYFLAEFRK